MSVKILIGPGIGGLLLKSSVVAELFERFPDLFDEPFLLKDFVPDGVTGGEGEEDALMFSQACVKGEQLFFLKDTAALRTLPWLIERIEREGSEALCRRGYNGKVVEIPDDVRWYIRSEDDGSESIHEEHRIWN